MSQPGQRMLESKYEGTENVPVLQVKNGKTIIPPSLALEEGKEMTIRLVQMEDGRERHGIFSLQRLNSSKTASSTYRVWDSTRAVELAHEVEAIAQTTFDETLTEWLHLDFPDMRFFDLETQIDLLVSGSVKGVRGSRNSRGSGSGQNHGRGTARMNQRLLHYYGKYMLIKGDFQTQKSKAMICLAMGFWLRKKSSLIILRNTNADLYQLNKRFQERVNEAKLYLRSRNQDADRLNIDIYSGSIPTDHLDDLLTGRRPRIMFLIANEKNIRREINQHLADAPARRKNFVLFIDECDDNDKAMASQKRPSKRSIELAKLKANAFCTFGVSATPLDTLMEQDIQRGEMFVLSRPENYQGFSRFLHCPITNQGIEVDSLAITEEQMDEDEKDTTFTSGSDEDILEKDKTMRRWLAWLAKQQPETVSYYKEKHPVTALIRVGDATDPMKNLGRYIAETHGREIATIVYMGDGSGGIEMNYPGAPATSITLGDGTVSTITEDGWHRLKKTGISQVYQHLRKLGVERIPRIVTIAGDLAGRGISFTSGRCDQRNNEDGKMNWHTLHLRIVLPKKSDSPTILQAAARLCCVANDNLTLRLWCTGKAYETIKHFYIGQEELITHMREIQEEKFRADSTISISRELLPTIPMGRDKIPKRHSITNHAPFKIKRVAPGKDGGWDIKEYKLDWEREREAKEEKKSDREDRKKIEGKERSETGEETVYHIDLTKMTGKSLETARVIESYLRSHKNEWIPLRMIVQNQFPDNEFEERRAITFHFTERYGTKSGSSAQNIFLVRKAGKGGVICGKINS